MRNNIDVTSLILQVYSVILLLQDYNNSDLMSELQKQDKEYFEKNDVLVTNYKYICQVIEYLESCRNKPVLKK